MTSNESPHPENFPAEDAAPKPRILEAAAASEPEAAPGEAAAEAARIETLTPPAPGEHQALEFSDEDDEGGGEVLDTELAHTLSSPAGMRGAIEALLFVTPEALTPHRIARALEMNDTKLVQTLLDQLRHDYDDQKRGIQIIETAEGYQMATREVFGDLILRLKNRKRRPTLSQAALETLAIIAYRQPIIRAEVEAVRGVESSGTIRNLIDMGLVEMVGRKEVLGRPPMYGTTEQFLHSFGLRNLGDLPSIGELKRRFAENEAKQAEAPPPTPPPAAALHAEEEVPPGDLPGQMFIEVPEDEPPAPAAALPPLPAEATESGQFEPTGDDFGDGDEAARHARRLAAASDPEVGVDHGAQDAFNASENPIKKERAMKKDDQLNKRDEEDEVIEVPDLEDEDEDEEELEGDEDEDWDDEDDENLEDEGDEEEEEEEEEDEDEEDDDEFEDDDEDEDEDEDDDEDEDEDEDEDPGRGKGGKK